MRRAMMVLLAALLAAGCNRKEEPVARPGSAAIVAAGTELPSEPRGFRGVGWGAVPAEVAGLEETAADVAEASGPGDGPAEQVYTRRGEEATLAGVALRKVEYRFRDGRFVRAVVCPEGGEAAALALKAALFDRYGAVGPAIGGGPAGFPAGGPYKEYRWTFPSGTVVFYLDTSARGSLLVFAAAEPDAARLH